VSSGRVKFLGQNLNRCICDMRNARGREGDNLSADIRIRKVKVLQGRAKEEAEKLKLDPNDLVIVTTSVNSLPEYRIEKIEGDPVSYLLKRAKD
jgi:hypothetical protein